MHSTFILISTFMCSLSLAAVSPNAPLINDIQTSGFSSADGKLDSTACRLAGEYARRLARQDYLDHHAGFEERAEALGGSVSEIIAQTWGPDLPEPQHAAKCVRLWEGSPGHYQHMKPYHDRFCYAMAPSKTGRFYCVGLFSDY
jgi:hypothetical protein